MQASLAVVGDRLGVGAWMATSDWRWLPGAVLLLANRPHTHLAVRRGRGAARKAGHTAPEAWEEIAAMTASTRALLGFVAAVISLLTFHQGAWALLYAAGLMPVPPYPTQPVPPLGAPLVASFGFWAGVWGAAFGLALPRLPRAPLWLLGLGLGLLAVLVLWFVVAPLKGQPVASGFAPVRMLVGLLIHLAWGLGVGLILTPLLRGKAAARA